MFKHLSKLKTTHQIIFALMIAFAVIAFWRGAWGLLEVYVLSFNYVVGSWILLLIGFSILAATHYITKELL